MADKNKMNLSGKGKKNKNGGEKKKVNLAESAKNVTKGGGKKAFQNGSYSVIYTIIVIALVVIVNLIIREIPSQYTEFDLSSTKLYSITDDTEEFLDTLEEDITLYYVVEEGEEDSVVETLLERYEDYSGHLSVVKKDPVLNPNFTAEYTDSDLSENSVIVVCGDNSKVVSYDDMYEYEYSYTTYSYSTTGFDGEGLITSAIEYVISDDIPVLYVLEGHNEFELTDSVTDAFSKENIDVQTLNLLTEESVPEDASAILICAPTTDLSSDETDAVIEYLEGGGNALIFSDYTTEDMSNFESILANYGVGIVDGYVMEADTSHYGYQMVYYLIPNVEDTDITADLYEDGSYILMPLAQGIEKLDSVRDTITITSLLTTSDSAYSKTDLENMETTDKEDGDIDGPFDLGVYITEDLDDGTTEIVYFSSSTLLNETVDESVSGNDTDLVASAAAAICKSGDDTTSVSIASKSLSTSYLTLTAFDMTFWMIITIGVIPVACILIGLVIWLKRRKL